MILTQEYKANWSTLSKVVFRFVFCYVSLYIFLTFTSILFETPIRWVEKLFLNIDYDYKVFGYGSGDNTFAYATLFFNFLASVFATIIWTILDRKRKSYNNLFYWFMVAVRMYVIYFMFVYGFAKVIKSQFPYPSLARMLQPLKDFSPMGLAWTYMGYSNGFNIFTGALEVFAGLLLIPRRTQAFGGLMVAGVMAHIAAMNFMFDIPVKIFSTHLALFGLLIFSTDIKRFINIFILNKPTKAYNYFRPSKETSYNKITLALKITFAILLLLLIVPRGLSNIKKWGDSREKPHLYGIWEVSHFVKNNDTIPPLLTNNNRWRYLVINNKDYVMVKKINDEKIGYDFVTDTVSKTIHMYRSANDSLKNKLSYYYPNKEFLQIKGTLENDSIDVIFSRLDHTKFQLNSRGFNWINERPFNR